MKLRQLDKNIWIFDDAQAMPEVYEQLDDALGFLEHNMLTAAELTLTKLLKLHPLCIDAWVHLAIVYERSGRLLEAYLACREAYRVGLNAIPKTFDWNKDLLEWGFLENRPFLRAAFNLALHLGNTQREEEAVEILTHLVEISPHDNLGARYSLLKIFLNNQNKLKIQWLLTRYPDDYSPEFLYAKVLYNVMQQDESAAKETFDVAKDAFPLVARELKKKRHPKPSGYHEEYVMVGGKDQAYVYWREFGQLWAEGTQAHDFLLANM